MSDTKNAWRQSGSHRQQASRSGSGTNTPVSRPRPESINFSQVAKSQAPPANAPQPAAPPATNAWADRMAKNATARQGTPPQAAKKNTLPSASAAPGGIKHVPVNDFNRDEVLDFFRKGYTISLSANVPSGLEQEALYKAPHNENKKPPATDSNSKGREQWNRDAGLPANSLILATGEHVLEQLIKVPESLGQSRGG